MLVIISVDEIAFAKMQGVYYYYKHLVLFFCSTHYVSCLFCQNLQCLHSHFFSVFHCKIIAHVYVVSHTHALNRFSDRLSVKWFSVYAVKSNVAARKYSSEISLLILHVNFSVCCCNLQNLMNEHAVRICYPIPTHVQ